MSATIPKAIDTRYDGHLFRSRLEARWAVFFKMLGIEYVYEMEGFELEDGLRYLPDFYIPHLDCWIEIKPTEPSEMEEKKAELLCAATQKRAYIFYGTVREPSYERDNFSSAEAFFPEPEGRVSGDTSHWWCICPTCGIKAIQHEGKYQRECGHGHDKDRTYNSPALLAAYEAALSYRFEAKR